MLKYYFILVSDIKLASILLHPMQNLDWHCTLEKDHTKVFLIVCVLLGVCDSTASIEMEAKQSSNFVTRFGSHVGIIVLLFLVACEHVSGWIVVSFLNGFF